MYMTTKIRFVSAFDPEREFSSGLYLEKHEDTNQLIPHVLPHRDSAQYRLHKLVSYIYRLNAIRKHTQEIAIQFLRRREIGFRENFWKPLRS